jgi:hypothetical protein
VSRLPKQLQQRRERRREAARLRDPVFDPKVRNGHEHGRQQQQQEIRQAQVRFSKVERDNSRGQNKRSS